MSLSVVGLYILQKDGTVHLKKEYKLKDLQVQKENLSKFLEIAAKQSQAHQLSLFHVPEEIQINK